MEEFESELDSTENYDLNKILIHLVQGHNLLYDKSSDDYKNVTKKNDIWKKITREIDATSKRYNKSAVAIESKESCHFYNK